MTRATTPKPADSARPTSNLFSQYQPNSSVNANNYNPYNAAATNQALADQNNAGYWAGQAQLGQAKEAASFGATLGAQTSAAQAAQNAASAQSKNEQDKLNSFSSTSGIGQGTGRLAFGGVPATSGYNKNDRIAAMQLQDRQQKEFQDDVFKSERDRYNQQLLANNSVSNQTQLTAQNQRGEQALAQIQGANQIEAAKIAANAQLGAAEAGAQANMMSSLFSSLGNMTSSIGGGGGRRGYW